MYIHYLQETNYFQNAESQETSKILKMLIACHSTKALGFPCGTSDKELLANA